MENLKHFPIFVSGTLVTVSVLKAVESCTAFLKLQQTSDNEKAL
jgi:hypothetical protein